MGQNDDAWSANDDLHGESDDAFSERVVDMAIGAWNDQRFAHLITTCWPSRVVAAAALRDDGNTSEYTWSCNASTSPSGERTKDSNQYSVTLRCYRSLPSEFAARLFDAFVAITRRVVSQDDVQSPWLDIGLPDLAPLLQRDHRTSYSPAEIRTQLVQLATVTIDTKDDYSKAGYRMFEAAHSSSADGTVLHISLRWTQAIYDAITRAK